MPTPRITPNASTMHYYHQLTARLGVMVGALLTYIIGNSAVVVAAYAIFASYSFCRYYKAGKRAYTPQDR